MILTQPLEKNFDIGEDINLGIVNNVKRIMENMLSKLQDKNTDEIMGVKTDITKVQEEIMGVKTEITKVQEEIITKLQADITSMREDMKILITMMSEKQPS
jgi:peptidoglycan hydrolase CwlO-like protein